MNDPTAALIGRYYQAFNDRDHGAMLDLLTDDVVHDINQGGREVGREAFAHFLAHMDRCYEERAVDLVVMANPDGTRAAAEFVIEGRYLASDAGFPVASRQDYRLPVAALFEIREGRIARVSTHYNVQDWLRQIGA